MLGLLRLPAILLAAQQGHLFPWAPVAFGTGIGVYFAWPGEPGPGTLWLLAGLALGLGGAALRVGTLLGPPLWALALLAAGFDAAAARSALVAAPVLGFRYYGPVEGRIVAIDRSASDAQRLTLDRVILLRVDPAAVPERVRLSLHGDPLGARPIPGARISATAHLSPPSGPVEPGGFDFRRHAWFARLGALGYTSAPALILAPPEPGEVRVLGWRLALADRVRAALPGETGAFGAAVMTGDRSGMGQATLAALRKSNLAHLLAISGLHMGLLAGFVFGAVRLALACWPWAALRWPLHKIAALVALLAAAAYLVLSGGSVATERAFVMVAVALGALLGNRRALSLRAVALAALIVLVLRPEALLGPGFQMSFAATLALVAAFDLLRRHPLSGRWRWLAPVLAMVLSSAVAGAATAPVAAAHFNQIARLGLLANLLAVPVMGLVVMPAAVVSACLMPLGLAAPALWVMGQGLGWILTVATRVAARPEALLQVPTPDAAVLPLLAFGGLLLCLWRGRLRGAGLAPLAVALWLWAGAERPALLVDETGGLVGVMTSEGRALSRASGSGFVAQTWLENDGDGASQAVAAARWNLVPEDLVRHVTGRKRVAALEDCDGAALLVSNAPAPRLSSCLVLDSTRLRRTGAVALDRDGVFTTASGQAKGRPWAPSGKSVGPLVLPALTSKNLALAAQ
ncbi:ComEC/Rec2 family competence protein [Pseudooceanicola sp.]|uniref:ComEC/Rec2 family competence protein n=1 Tax=Pseudooceanicola sp. TaxID=1914328 RepID=UPI00262FF0FE|nr:ComEC/Rec2 family competence protein [Pseudooceanicola sp.]MDF1855448.1 ComEC/Rec2 family competence protein [Pseudooceanicola sp.]